MATPDIPADLLRLAEALVFASPEPATWTTLAPWLPSHLDAQAVFQALQDHCAGRGVILVEHAGGWVFRTAPDLTEQLQASLARHRRLPRAAMEVLVVVALHQPVTRPEIESVRGVSVGQATMDLLLESGMIAAHGRKQVPGTPTLWVTTPRFLSQFGLRSIRDLPGAYLKGEIPTRRIRGRTASATPDAAPYEDDELGEELGGGDPSAP